MQATNLEDMEKDLLVEVETEIEKLKYYLEELDETIEEGDFVEIEVTQNRTTARQNRPKAHEQSVRDLGHQEALHDKKQEMWEKKFHRVEDDLEENRIRENR